MARQGSRLHRLPQRLDYTLIPAPLDLSLPTITEKSPLPAIIVTPSSPIHTQDFSIAFLAPPPKPSLRERFINTVTNIGENFWLAQSRTLRTLLILTLFFFVMITTHLITHRIAAYPYSRFDSDVSHRHLNADPIPTTRAAESMALPNGEAQVGILNWIGFEFRKAWSVGGGVAVEDFFVIESNVAG